MKRASWSIILLMETMGRVRSLAMLQVGHAKGRCKWDVSLPVFDANAGNGIAFHKNRSHASRRLSTTRRAKNRWSGDGRDLMQQGQRCHVVRKMVSG